jgi:transmembrane sensor
MTNTQSLNESASVWLERVHSGCWTEQDQAGLDVWLAESSAHRAAYWRLEDAWSNASRLTALRQPMRPSTPPRRILPILARAAGAIVLVGTLGIAGTKYFAGPDTRTYATGLGGRETLALSDGSRIELNTNSVLRIAAKANGRTVWLDKGEAYFEIKHDAAHPFVVFAAGQRVTDLGTKFLVRQKKGSVEVALIEGSARVENDSNHAQSAVLQPGEIAVATADKLSVVRNGTAKLANELSWRQDQLVFTETTLAEAVAEFNRYNSTKLLVTDPAVARLKINGTFPTTGAEMFARVSQHILQLHTAKRGNEIVISR